MSQDTILIAFYVITLVDVLIAAGFSISGLVRPESVAPGPQNSASAIFASYAAARALPLAFVTIVAIVMHATLAVFWLGFLAGLIQLADAWIGFQQRNVAKAVGPLIIGIVQLAAVLIARKAGLG